MNLRGILQTCLSSVGHMVAAFGSARPTLSRAQRHCSRILQFQKQGTNIAFRYAIASHEKPRAESPNSSSRDGSEQRSLKMTSSHHNSATANRMSVNSIPMNLPHIDEADATRARGRGSAVGFRCRHQEFTGLVQRRLRVSLAVTRCLSTAPQHPSEKKAELV